MIQQVIIKFRVGLLLLVLSVLMASFISCQTTNNKQGSSDENVDPPNIILILADDMGYSDLGCYGGEISSPNLDLMASEGMRFTQFYNAARCCPTRASLLTGLYPHQAGMGGMIKDPGSGPEGPYQGYLNKECVTIAEVLKQAGYYTAASGKWHVGEERPHWPTDRGFDNYYGLISGAANYFDITRGKAIGAIRHFAIDSIEHQPPNEGFYMTDAITENAVKFVKKAGTLKQPFFLYIPYTAPHWPLHAKEEDIEEQKGKFLLGWDRLRRERYERMVEMGIIDKNWKLSERDPQVTPWSELDADQKENMDLLMAIYAAQIACMDQGIGKVLAQLDAIGETENTLIFFLSDNGGSEEYGPFGSDFWGNFWDGNARPGSGDSYHSYGGSWANLSNAPFRKFKKLSHEGGIATPLIVKWPAYGLAKGSLVHEPGHIIDIMATICDVADADYPDNFNNNKITQMEGSSMLPLFEGRKTERHEPLFWEHSGNRAVRKGDWKLVAEKGESWELYNISQDRSETENLIEENQLIAKELNQLYDAWAKEVGVDQ